MFLLMLPSLDPYYHGHTLVRVMNLGSPRSSFVMVPNKGQYEDLHPSPSYLGPHEEESTTSHHLNCHGGFLHLFHFSNISLHKDFKAFSAACKAGIASAKSASHESFSSFAAVACILHSASSLLTIAFCSSATTDS